MHTIAEKIKLLLKNITSPNSKTINDGFETYKIKWFENPLNPNLMDYCFTNILNFKVEHRIFEKVNYIIDFDYDGFLCRVAHFKLSYDLEVPSKYKDEIIETLSNVRLLLNDLFQDIAIEALDKNEFTMENDYPNYLEKLNFYDSKIEELHRLIEIVADKGNGQYDVFETSYGSCMKPKFQDYLRKKRTEIVYHIESYIDVFFSLLEHGATLLYPFSKSFKLSDSYKNKILNSKWTWDKKICELFEPNDIDEILESLRQIKEIYRNRNTHGLFSRELKIYTHINHFGRYPLFIGKKYLKGFIEDYDIALDYEKFIGIKAIFNDFLCLLDKQYSIPMVFIKSGVPISVDVSSLIKSIHTISDAEKEVSKIFYDMDNQYNMDW